ncbi:MAG: transcriptional repressor [Myxococcota bacterium]
MARNTEQRRAIEGVFTRIPRPLTIQEVLNAAQEDVPGMGVATVYRNIKIFVEQGWLTLVKLPGEPSRYERSNIGHHHHFHCRRCDRVFDINACPGGLDALVPPGFTVEEHAIVLYGQCRDCC